MGISGHLSGIFRVGSLGILIKKLSQVRTTGWSVYPPVVESGQQHFPVPQSDPISNTLTNFLLLVQLLLLITTVFFAYRPGTPLKKNRGLSPVSRFMSKKPLHCFRSFLFQH